MNRQSRPPSSSLLPDFYASKKSIIVENQKRKNSTVISYIKDCIYKKRFQNGTSLLTL